MSHSLTYTIEMIFPGEYLSTDNQDLSDEKEYQPKRPKQQKNRFYREADPISPTTEDKLKEILTSNCFNTFEDMDGLDKANTFDHSLKGEWYPSLVDWSLLHQMN